MIRDGLALDFQNYEITKKFNPLQKLVLRPGDTLRMGSYHFSCEMQLQVRKEVHGLEFWTRSSVPTGDPSPRPISERFWYPLPSE